MAYSSSSLSLSPDTKDLSHPSGEVHVIVGPMFAGKTTALLRRIKSELNAVRLFFQFSLFFFLYRSSLIPWFYIGCFANSFVFLLWRNVVMLKSSKDTRYAIDSVVTHDGVKFPCWALPNLLSFREEYGHDAYQKVFFFFVLLCLLFSKVIILSFNLFFLGWIWFVKGYNDLE